MKIETIKIVDKDHPDGHKVINKCDMQKGDKEYKEPKKKKE